MRRKGAETWVIAVGAIFLMIVGLVLAGIVLGWAAGAQEFLLEEVF
ncbi:MAG: hypothetical protein SVU88_04155 [Candidatus Nanohaloarchaea archaeon]|nr:hypothetical protein [Candidatus Nanohaloarchaea archaeon]